MLDLLVNPPVVKGLEDEGYEGDDDDEDQHGDNVLAVVDAFGLEVELAVTLFAAVRVTYLNVDVFGVVAALGAGLAEVHVPTRFEGVGRPWASAVQL